MMAPGRRYRIVGMVGTLVLTVVAVATANYPLVVRAVHALPILGRLPADPATGQELLFEAGTTAGLVLATMVPLFKPHSRRILDIVACAARRVVLAVIALAAVGYFDYTYRLPRLTLLVAGGFLFVLLPGWFVLIRRRPTDGSERAVVIGDDSETMADILAATDLSVLGYVSPPAADRRDRHVANTPTYADGGLVASGSPLEKLECLGGLSRLDEVLVKHDVDTAMLAFTLTDRAEFFGALDTCYEHGVTTKTHRKHADSVLTNGIEAGELIDIDIEPWDPQDHVFKRVFDLVFATVGLVGLAPLLLVIAAAVRWEDGGPVLYSQERTAAFGDTFTVYKFRSMVPDAEDETGATLSEADAGGVGPRPTRVGQFIRQTHLDELPQLWSVLVGDMSVVGPHPERPELDTDMQSETGEWRCRWFVKPGLTGLAQVQGATGYDSAEKLHYDVQYIRRQSFWFDLTVVVRQVWQVLWDARAISFRHK